MSDTERAEPAASSGAATATWEALSIYSDAALCLIDPDGRVREVSNAIEFVTGVPAETYRNHPAQDYVHPNDVGATRHVLAELAEVSDGARRRVRLRLLASGGAWRWVDVVITRALDQPDLVGFVASLRDVDEEHRATERLRESEREARSLIADLEQEDDFLHIVLDASSDAVIIVGADLMVRWVSPSIERLTSWTLAELRELDPRGLVHPDDAEAAFEALAVLFRNTGQTGQIGDPVELRVRHRDGTWHWMIVTGHDLRSTPAINGIVLAFHDINERHQARREVEASERRFRALVHHGSDVVYTFDDDLVVTSVSSSIEQILGYSTSDPIGLGAFHSVVSEHVGLALDVVERLRSHPGRTEHFRVQLVDASGSLRWVDARITNLLDRPEVGEWVCNFWDVTDAVEAEQALASSERRFEAMVRNSSDFIVVFAADMRTRYISAGAERLLGWDLSVYPGREIGYGIPDADRLALEDGFRRVVENQGETVWVQIKVPHAEGGWVWLESVLSNHLDDPEIQGVIGNFRDVTEQRALVRELEARSEVFQSLAFSSTTGLFEEDSLNGTTHVNERWVEITGVAAEAAQAIGWQNVLMPEVTAPPLDSLAPGYEDVRRLALRAADGATVTWIDVRSVVLPADDHGVVKRVGGIEDVTAIVRAEDENRQLANIFDLTDDVVILVDASGRLMYLNSSGRRALGMEDDEFERAQGQDWTPMTWIGAALKESIDNDVESDFTSWSGELAIEHPDGVARPMSIQVLSHRGEDGSIEFFSAVLHDISERKQLEASLERQASHDPLTGLPNRTLLFERIHRAIEGLRSAASLHRVGVLFIDLDHFKVINDSLGHALGDRLLRAIGERIRTAVRPGDTVARFGGDEFVVLCERLDTVDDAAAIAHRVETTLQAPFLIDGHEIHAGVSIGISFADASEPDPVAILRDADTAMYQAKSDGRGRWVMFDEDLRRRAVERQRIETALRQTRHGEDLVVHYQPVVDLRTGGVRAVEALLRWNRDGEFVRPDDFVPVAEETGLIVPIGSWVLDSACRQVAAWQTRQGWNELGLSVNVSARQLLFPGFPATVAAILAGSQLGPDTLAMEITETVLLDDVVQASRRLEELRSLGIRIAVDDFGTGYSSLTYLDRLPVDLVKLDRSFVAGVGTDAKRTAIVTSVVNLAQALGLDAVAEGIETDQQRSELYRLGCRYGQGFLVASPMSAEELEESLVYRWGALRLRTSAELNHP